MEDNDLKLIYDQSFPRFREGEIIRGRIVRRFGNSVLIDLGLKSEGVLPLDEFNSLDEAQEGKDVWVYLEAFEDREGFPVVSKRKADFELAWDSIQKKKSSSEPVTAIVKKKIKGGLAVEIFGLEAFLPSSQVDVKPWVKLDELINKSLEVKIIQVNRFKKNIVVSRRQLIEEEQEKARTKALERINTGDIVEGTVKAITEFGAFVDLGGIDALLHISDFSWNKVVHPNELVQIGDRIKVKVLNCDKAGKRVSVGLKQLTPHPWDNIEERFPIGSRVKGTVTALAEYGAFVELEKGVEGLIHISELSWTKTIHHPSQVLKVSDIVEAVILNIDKDDRRISLGLKQTLPDPWSLIDEKYQVGQRISGRIKSLKDFGAFVEIEEGIEGLIRNDDLSWTKRVKHPREVVKKNQKVEAIIVEIDKENRRIGLGLKQAKEDPFYHFGKEFKEGDKIKVRIIDLPKPGVVVNLPYGIESFIPIAYLARGGRKSKDRYKIGEELEVKITGIDFDSRRVYLSEKALLGEELSAAAPDKEGHTAAPKGGYQKKPREPKKKDWEEGRFTLEDHLK